ncbi:hypothetical protein CTI12_AA632190 [Artemisia annua]|uniref:Uncharacterized protein n=1 Tax=Artemisia annua TaxID=35608 RepID=A0A2U1K8F0_ARTAN|nr:hypothetical protein CTI12_AA632190 [Artemisia annua]
MFSSFSAACDKSCEDGVLLGNSVIDDTLKEPPSQPHGPSLVADSSKPKMDALNDATNVKVHESGSTSASTSLGVKVVIPITVVEDMCQKYTNTLYGYFIGQRLAFDSLSTRGDFLSHSLNRTINDKQEC